MKIAMPEISEIKRLFREYDKAENPRDRGFKMGEISNFFRNYYMEKIEIILAIAGEMQKHFKEEK
jgi:hypothetical protein